MNNNDARAQLNEVRQAYRDSARPPLPLSIKVGSGILAGIGVALLGQTPTSRWLPFLGLAIVAVAYLLPSRHRAQHGLVGYQGQARQTNVVLGLSVVALFICGLTANSTIAWIYLALGLAFGVNYFFALRGWGIPK